MNRLKRMSIFQSIKRMSVFPSSWIFPHYQRNISKKQERAYSCLVNYLSASVPLIQYSPCCQHEFFYFIYLFMFVFFVFLGLHPWHMEVPSLGVESELQPLAYTVVTATQDPSRICDLHHSSRPRQILNPLSEARDRINDLMVPSQIRFCWATTGTPENKDFLLHKHSIFVYVRKF